MYLLPGKTSAKVTLAMIAPWESATGKENMLAIITAHCSRSSALESLLWMASIAEYPWSQLRRCWKPVISAVNTKKKCTRKEQKTQKY